MILYACIMFLCALLFLLLGLMIRRGSTDLIHDYHQTRVKDKAAYGRAFSRGMLGIALSMALSGAAAFLGDSRIWLAVGILLVGFVLSIWNILLVQKKFNGGLF